MKKLIFATLALLLVIGSGCATRYGAAKGDTGLRLHVEPVADGCLLSWVSEAGKTYTVLYSSSLTEPDWKPLPGFINMAGTGENLRVPDMAPKDEMRFYKVVVNP